MRVLHFSDTHLGYNELDKIGPNGINLREQDFYQAFEYVIDKALELKPDIVIHSGDFFHRPSPPNRPMIFALEQLKRLSRENIPIVIIAGNHETPRTVYTSPILKAFNTIDGVYSIFEQHYDKFEFGDLVVHGIPHINDEKKLAKELGKAQAIKGKFNIILLHTSVGNKFMMKEYGELILEDEELSPLTEFDYIALGHWHNFQHIKSLKHAWYCGSTERMSHNEAREEKVFLTFELKKNKPVEPVRHPIPTRAWHYIEIDCKGQTVEQIKEELLTFADTHKLEEALLSIHFKQIKSGQSLLLSRRTLMGLLPGCVHINLSRKFVKDEEEIVHADELQSINLSHHMTDFIEKEIEDKDKVGRLTERIGHYFDRYNTK